MTKYALLSVLLIGVFGYTQAPYLTNPNCYYFDFLDVGQGDSILVTTPTHKNILIDGGPGQAVLDQLGATMPWWDKEIDLVVLTHPHADHLDGLLEVFKRFKVNQFYLTGATYNSSQYEELYGLISEYQIPYKFATSSIKAELDALSLEFIYPNTPYLGREPPENINNSSIAGKISVDGFKFLFTGDAELEEEAALLQLDYDFGANLFKAGHHGSRTSSSPALIDRINPQFVVIQSGQGNSYGHPHRQTLDTFAQRNLQLYRNDLQGDIKFAICAGQVDSISTSR
ncbi:hypothetical protein CO045_01120 [Candidatus Peregrinibacteria bacterium CG_4_9_14_0_2_um_filter_41_14]|nr:MAG: hypothetical protein CO045_01120 [Candidatus Peregrinibacteria bacterium CG_4_9_14_0_2_um_filter_41_14]